MTRITCEAALWEKLHGLRRTLGLCDESGRVLAWVMPPIEIRREGVLHEWVSLRECGDVAPPRVNCDLAMREKLNDFAEPLELCDESGRVLARIVPAVETQESDEPQITNEEWERRMKSRGKTYTTAEVLAYLNRI